MSNVFGELLKVAYSAFEIVKKRLLLPDSNILVGQIPLTRLEGKDTHQCLPICPLAAP